jgi:HAMP domain-containing protein
MNMLHSLQTKLTASFVVLILVVSSLTFFYTFSETKSALKELTQDELQALAAVTASQLSGADADAMSALKEGDETQPVFVVLRDKLKAIRASHSDIKYVYTMRRTDGGVVFLVDADHGNKEDPGAAIGEQYEGTKGELLKGFSEPSVDEDFTSDKWGTFLSGYAPIRNSQGAIIGLIGIDMASDRVIEKQEFIGTTIYYVMAVAIVLAGFFILLFSKTIIKDIHELNRVANAISMGDMDVDMDVRRKDEIGALAESFGRMVASLKIMMMMGGGED